jgi:hypothetical protein
LTQYPSFNYLLPTDKNGTFNGIPFDEYSASVKVDEDTYLISVNTGVFNKNFNEFINLPSQNTYLTMIYDGDENIYVYPYIGNIICRFNIGKGISLFIPFCLNTAYPSCGSVYFDNNSELVLNGTGNGVVYAVRYNVLRVQNGMAALLYA